MKTVYRTQKEASDLALYNEYSRIISANPNAMATAVEAVLMKKFKLHSRASVWRVIDRVKKRLQRTT